jgi:hypothetical protein
MTPAHSSIQPLATFNLQDATHFPDQAVVFHSIEHLRNRRSPEAQARGDIRVGDGKAARIKRVMSKTNPSGKAFLGRVAHRTQSHLRSMNHECMQIV